MALDMHTVTKATEDMDGTDIESSSSAIENRSKELLKSVLKLLSDKRSEIEPILEDLSVVTKASAETIVETRLTNWTRTLHTQVVKAVELTFEDALQASYYYSINPLKTAKVNLDQQTMAKWFDLIVHLQLQWLRCAITSKPSCYRI